MTAARREIREAVCAVLKAAETTVGDRVFENRVVRFQHGHLPAAAIYTLGEDVTELGDAPRAYLRECKLVVHIRADGEEAVDDTLDGIAQEFESALELALDAMVASVASLSNLELTAVQGPDLDRDGSQIIGGINLVYAATYTTEYAAATSETDDFARLDTSIESHGPREGAEVTDQLDLPTA